MIDHSVLRQPFPLPRTFRRHQHALAFDSPDPAQFRASEKRGCPNSAMLEPSSEPEAPSHPSTELCELFSYPLPIEDRTLFAGLQIFNTGHAPP